MVEKSQRDPGRRPLDAATSQHLRREALFAFESGRLSDAAAALRELIAELGVPATVPLKSELCQAWIDHATVLRFANRWDEALDALAQAEALAPELPPLLARSKETTLLLIRAKIQASALGPARDPSAAVRSLDRLRKLQPEDLAWIADEIEGDLAFRNGDWTRAIDLSVPVLEQLAREGWAGGAASLRLRTGAAWLELGKLERAEADLTAAHEHLSRFGAPDMRAKLELLFARLCSLQGDHSRAWSHTERALEGFESLIRGFRVLSEQQLFLMDKLGAYNHAFGIARAGGDCAKWRLRAWAVAERAKGFSLSQLLANADTPLFAGAADDDLARLRALEEDLDRIELSCKASSDASLLPGREAQLTAVYRERQALLAKLMRDNPRWAALRQPPRLDLDRELEHLHLRGWRPISFYWQEPSGPPQRGRPSAVLHVFRSQSPGAVEHAAIPWSCADRERLAAARAALSGPVPASLDLCPDDLVEKIWPPTWRLAAPADDRSTLLVSAHQDLQMLPLHAFGSEGRRILDHRAVQYIPSLSLLPLGRRVDGGTGDVAVIGCVQDGFGDEPLDNVEREVDEIAKAWSAQKERDVVRKLIAPDGGLEQEGIPLQTWRRFRYLHIACHGDFPEHRPFDASLRLGSEAVRMAELFATRLDALLVSLSACSLGRHSHAAGSAAGNTDEWVGMYLPLFYAGASTLLLSLWDADSACAATLMTALHREIASGNASPALALRRAFAEVASDPSPLWANWYLVGIPNLS